MHLSLGGIVKGVTTGLLTLAETANPVVAAGAGAMALLSNSSAQSGGTTPVPTFSPLLDELSAENPTAQQNVNALSSYADLIAA